MPTDLTVPGSLNAQLQTVSDQTGNASALQLATSSVAISSTGSTTASTPPALGVNATNTNTSAGIAMSVGGLSTWGIFLRTNQGSGNWLELTANNGAVRHSWSDGNYTATGNLTVQGPTITFSGLANLPSSGTVDLAVNSAGVVSTQTSSARFKEQVEPLTTDFDAIMRLEPRTFVYRGTSDRTIGYTAEEVAEHELPGLVSYDAEGRPLTVHYKLLPVYLLEVIKRQQATLQTLQEQVSALLGGSPAAEAAGG